MSERYSRQREAIRKELKKENRHPTASEIYEAVREEYPHISIGTVYRNLTEMKNAGEIVSIETGSHAARHDGNTSDHCHFICRMCGNVLDICDGGCSALIPDAEKESGGKIENCSVTFTGLCSECVKMMDK
ncbi:MAG: transcriptional repressor [Anaerovoracaceae bacterium]|nr:transcriptional repressor [Anaerovoracaceae bacterium]